MAKKSLIDFPEQLDARQNISCQESINLAYTQRKNSVSKIR